MADEDEDYEVNDFEDDDNIIDDDNDNEKEELNVISYDEILEKINNKKKKTVPFFE